MWGFLQFSSFIATLVGNRNSLAISNTLHVVKFDIDAIHGEWGNCTEMILNSILWHHLPAIGSESLRVITFVQRCLKFWNDVTTTHRNFHVREVHFQQKFIEMIVEWLWSDIEVNKIWTCEYFALRAIWDVSSSMTGIFGDSITNWISSNNGIMQKLFSVEIITQYHSWYQVQKISLSHSHITSNLFKSFQIPSNPGCKCHFSYQNCDFQLLSENSTVSWDMDIIVTLEIFDRSEGYGGISSWHSARWLIFVQWLSIIVSITWRSRRNPYESDLVRWDDSRINSWREGNLRLSAKSSHCPGFLLKNDRFGWKSSKWRNGRWGVRN
jgi:hypothetical protein